MRVLHVTCGLEPDMGGPPVSVTTFCIAGLRVGIETHLAFSFNKKSIKSTRSARRKLRNAGVGLKIFHRTLNFWTRSKTWGISVPLILWLLRRAGEFDIIVIHGPWPVSSLAALVAAKIHRKRSILIPHESLTAIDMNKPGWAGRVFLKRILRTAYFHFADAIIVASPLERADSADRATRANIVVIPHAVYDDQLETLPPARSQLGKPPVLGYIGRLHFKKNVDVLLQALAVLPREVHLRIAGVGAADISAELKKLARDLEIEDRVEWLGLVTGSEKQKFFASIDLLLMPSLYESFGLVAAEAVMNGVPVIISPSTGVAGLVRAHDCGFVVPPTVDALAATVTRVFADEKLFSHLSMKALEAARSEVGYSAFATRIQSIYLSTAGVGG